MYNWRIAARLVLLSLTVLAAGCAAPDSTGPRTETVPIQIDSVAVDVGTPQPAPVQAVIKGVVGDSCNNLEKVAQSRQGKDITIKITAIRSLGVPCMEVAKLYNETLQLGGDFPPGQYTVTVNTVSKSFTVR
jgi:pyruvate-formate lyase-activating enzyme